MRKVHPDTNPPDFWFDGTDAEVLVVNYRSERGLCPLAEGMIAGTGTHYGQTVTVHQTACMHDGHEHCVLNVTFQSA